MQQRRHRPFDELIDAVRDLDAATDDETWGSHVLLEAVHLGQELRHVREAVETDQTVFARSSGLRSPHRMLAEQQAARAYFDRLAALDEADATLARVRGKVRSALAGEVNPWA
jgi:hypothetical protein